MSGSAKSVSRPGWPGIWQLVLLLCVALGDAAPAFAQAEVYAAEDVKAAFLYHFATFVLWPEDDRGDSHFTIAVLGAEGIADELAAYLPGRSIQGRPMRVQRLKSLDELDDAAVLFIGASENERLPDLLKRMGDRRMLVVTDAREALELGSMINFRLLDRRVRFEISLPATERAGLELSSRLLSAAMFVDTTSAIPPPVRRALASITAHGPACIGEIVDSQKRVLFKG